MLELQLIASSNIRCQIMPFSNILSRSLVLMVLISSLNACGFSLRGNTPLPEDLQNMYLDARTGPFKEQMEEILIRTGARLTEQREAADVQLSITESIVERTVGTLDERGKANSYLLNYRVRYSLVAADGRVLRSSAIDENRRYDFDPDIVLETESEQEELIQDMEQSVALRIIRQLNTVTTSMTAPASTGAS